MLFFSVILRERKRLKNLNLLIFQIRDSYLAPSWGSTLRARDRSKFNFCYPAKIIAVLRMTYLQIKVDK
ncbi:MAG: hypothetical protein A2052_07175 [Deltaproteobacteria bacterium GWA2_54_12]|nr:MAG: hypothetical protein A2052_07175 [Deltaproteobacteria bacterium GWA2_54_12]